MCPLFLRVAYSSWSDMLEWHENLFFSEDEFYQITVLPSTRFDSGKKKKNQTCEFLSQFG